MALAAMATRRAGNQLGLIRKAIAAQCAASLSRPATKCAKAIALREKDTGIERVEPDRPVQTFDCSFGIAGISADPTASLPRDREVHVQLQRAINKQQRALDVLEEECMHMARPAQGYGIVRTGIGRLLREASDLLFVESSMPSRLPSRRDNRKQPAHTALKTRDPFPLPRKRAVAPLHCLCLSSGSSSQGPQIEIIGSEIAGCVFSGAVHLRFLSCGAMAPTTRATIWSCSSERRSTSPRQTGRPKDAGRSRPRSTAQ